MSKNQLTKQKSDAAIKKKINFTTKKQNALVKSITKC